MTRILEQLEAEEGFVPYAYQDHLGFWTLGVGRLIDKRRGGGITRDEALHLLGNDVSRVTQDLVRRFAWFDRLNAARQAVLIGMAFQMGIHGLLGFEKTLLYVEAGQWSRAADQMLNSLWARQTPARARRMAQQMLTGEWQFPPGHKPAAESGNTGA